jgi:hypothetical protein
MSQTATRVLQPLVQIDYSLIGVNSSLAVERGVAEADWYQCPVPRETMRKLLERKARGWERRLPNALSEPFRCVAGDRANGVEAGSRPRLTLRAPSTISAGRP